MEVLSSTGNLSFVVGFFIWKVNRLFISLVQTSMIIRDHQPTFNLFGKMMKTVGFSDLETSEASDEVTSDFEEGAS